MTVLMVALLIGCGEPASGGGTGTGAADLPSTLESLPFASHGGIDVSEQDGVWLVETSDTYFALIKKLGDRWTSIGLPISPGHEFPGVPGLEQAMDGAAEKLS